MKTDFRFEGYSRRIMVAVVDAMVPRWPDYDPELQATVLPRVEDTLSHAPLRAQRAIKVALWALEWLGPLMLVGIWPLSWLGREARVRRLESLNHSSIVLFRRLIIIFKTVISIAAYSDPLVERHLGVERPGWRADRRKFRERLLEADAARKHLPVVPAALGCEGVTAPEHYLDLDPPPVTQSKPSAESAESAEVDA